MAVNDDIRVPKLKMPLSLDGVAAPLVEQDSLDEISQNVEAILSTPQGYRTELPEFGLPAQVFLLGGASPAQIRRAIEDWEPRAEAIISEDPEFMQDRLDVVNIDIVEAS